MLKGVMIQMYLNLLIYFFFKNTFLNLILIVFLVATSHLISY